MFDWGGSDRRRRDVAAIVSDLPGVLAEMHPIERASIMMLGNLSLGLAARIHGQFLLNDPPAAGPRVAHAALRQILPVRVLIVSGLGDETLPRVRHSRCYLGGLDLAVLTIGTALDPVFRAPCELAWRAVWADRGRLRDALVWFRNWERESGNPAFPENADGELPSDIDVLKASNHVPSFLVPRRRPQ